MDTFKNMEKYFNFRNRKRRRAFSFDEKDMTEIECQNKNFKSAESKKITHVNQDEINYFMARIAPKFTNQIFTEEDKLS